MPNPESALRHAKRIPSATGDPGARLVATVALFRIRTRSTPSLITATGMTLPEILQDWNSLCGFDSVSLVCARRLIARRMGCTAARLHSRTFVGLVEFFLQ